MSSFCGRRRMIEEGRKKGIKFVLPVDSIYDSPEEQLSFDVKGLTPGRHQVTLRATDARGNQAFENVFVTVEGPSAASK